MNATTPHVMFQSTTTSFDPARRLGTRSRSRTRLRRYTQSMVAALLLAVGGAASAENISQSWVDVLEGDIIGAALPLFGTVQGTFTVPIGPGPDTISDHGVVHHYKGAYLTGFAVTLSGGEGITVNAFIPFGILSSPKDHAHGFIQSNFDRGPGKDPYEGTIASVTAVGTHVWAPIPEPSTYALMAAGLSALVWWGRKKRSGRSSVN